MASAPAWIVACDNIDGATETWLLQNSQLYHAVYYTVGDTHTELLAIFFPIQYRDQSWVATNLGATLTHPIEDAEEAADWIDFFEENLQPLVRVDTIASYLLIDFV